MADSLNRSLPGSGPEGPSCFTGIEAGGVPLTSELGVTLTPAEAMEVGGVGDGVPEAAGDSATFLGESGVSNMKSKP